MLVFMDCEFTGLRQDTTLISLALVGENGKEFYAEFTDYNRGQVDEWVQKNVIDNLWHGKKIPGVTYIRGDSATVATALREWLLSAVDLQIVVDVGAWDWILFCNLLNGKLSPRIFYIPLDLSTMLWSAGYDPDVSREEFSGISLGYDTHNALWDAQVISFCYSRLFREGRIKEGKLP